jgi:tetratricopeptide (TPR) repeat protein
MKKSLYYLAAVSLVFLLPFAWEYPNPRLQLTATVGLVLIAGAWALWHARQNTPFIIPKFAIVLLVFLSWQVGLLFIAPVPIYGLRWIILELAVFLIFIIVVNTSQSADNARLWENTLIGVGLFFALIDLLQILSWYGSWWSISHSTFSLPPISNRAAGFFLGQPNLFSAYLNLVIPLVVMRIVNASDRSRRILWSEALVLLLVMQFFSSSRSGWLALAAALLLMLILSIQPSLKPAVVENALDWNKTKRYFLLGAVIVCTILFLSPAVARQVSLAAHGTFADRLDIWQFVLKQITASPFWGNGTGSMPFLLAMRSEAIGGDEVFHAHNLWLQISGENGILGLSIVLMAGFFIFRAFLSAWRSTVPKTSDRYALISYMGVITAVLVHSLVDVMFRRIMIVVGIFTVLALLFRLTSSREVLRLRRRLALPLFFTFIALFVLGSYYYDRGVFSYYRGLQAANNGNWQLAQQEVCHAADENPALSFYSFQCGLAYSFLASQNGDLQALHSAIEYQRRGLAVDPFWYWHWANLASYEWRAGEQQLALEHMNKANEMAPGSDFLRLNRAWMQDELGKHAEASENYQRLICINPWYAETKFFQNLSATIKLKEASCAQEIQAFLSSSYQWEMWKGWQTLKSGNLTQAEREFSQAAKNYPQFPEAYSFLALIHQQKGKVEQAQEDIDTALFIYDRSGRVLLNAAKVFQALGQDEKAFKYLSQMYELSQQVVVSNIFYNSAYWNIPFSTDVSPYMRRAGLSKETQQYLTDLADWLATRGDIGKSQQIRLFIQNQSQP